MRLCCSYDCVRPIYNDQILGILISTDRFKGKYDIGLCEFSYQIKLINYDFVMKMKMITSWRN